MLSGTRTISCVHIQCGLKSNLDTIQVTFHVTQSIPPKRVHGFLDLCVDFIGESVRRVDGLVLEPVEVLNTQRFLFEITRDFWIGYLTFSIISRIFFKGVRSPSALLATF